MRIVAIDARTGAEITVHAYGEHLDAVAWTQSGRLACLGQSGARKVLLPPLPEPSPAPSAPNKSAKAAKKSKAHWSAALELPFQLEWTQLESVLRAFVKGKPQGVYDRPRALGEAMLYASLSTAAPGENGFRADPNFLSDPRYVPLAAALLLKAPSCPAMMEELLSKHLDDSHVKAVAPLLSMRGKGRLACSYVLAGRALDPEMKAALPDYVLNAVWRDKRSPSSKLRRPGGHALTSSSKLEEVEKYCRTYGDAEAVDAILADWERERRATNPDEQDVDMNGPLNEIVKTLEKSSIALGRALLSRYLSTRGSTDRPEDVAPFLSLLDSDVKPFAIPPQLLYALLTLARHGSPIPERASAVRAALLAELTVERDVNFELDARVLAVLPMNEADAPLVRVWIYAVRGEVDALVPLLRSVFTLVPPQRYLPKPALALAEFLAATADAKDVPRLSEPMLGTQVERNAWEMLLRARDAGVVAEDPSWFTSGPISSNPTKALDRCGQATRDAVVAKWLESGTSLQWAGKYDYQGAVRVAIERADSIAIANLCLRDRVAEWLPIVREHLHASKDIEAVVARLQYSGVDQQQLSALMRKAKERAGLGNETATQKLERLSAAVLTASKVKMIFFYQPTGRANDSIGKRARSTYVRIDGLENEDQVLTLHLADVPELQSKFPGAASITVFGTRGKNPQKVRTRIAMHDEASPEHRALEAAPPRLRYVEVELPDDYLGSYSRYAGLRSALPYPSFIVKPHYTGLPQQPLFEVSDTTVVELEEDEGPLLVFESGVSRHRG